MITVVKGDSKIVVTKATYEEQLKKLGYSVVASKKKEATKKVASNDIKENDEEDLDKLLKKDLEEKQNLSEKYGFTNAEKKSSISKRGK